jgi:hypothetical protein
MSEIRTFVHGHAVDLSPLPPVPEFKPLKALHAEAGFPRWAPSIPEEREPSKAEVWKPGEPCPFDAGVVVESKKERSLWTCSTPGCAWSWFGLKVRG